MFINAKETQLNKTKFDEFVSNYPIEKEIKRVITKYNYNYYSERAFFYKRVNIVVSVEELYTNSYVKVCKKNYNMELELIDNDKIDCIILYRYEDVIEVDIFTNKTNNINCAVVFYSEEQKKTIEEIFSIKLNTENVEFYRNKIFNSFKEHIKEEPVNISLLKRKESCVFEGINIEFYNSTNLFSNVEQYTYLLYDIDENDFICGHLRFNDLLRQINSIKSNGLYQTIPIYLIKNCYNNFEASKRLCICNFLGLPSIPIGLLNFNGEEDYLKIENCKI